MGTGGSFLRVKQPGRETEHSSPTTALCHKPSWYNDYVVKHRDKTLPSRPRFYLEWLKKTAKNKIEDT
jgi:hypothetical protein